ncbi:hypothetical protein [Pelagicoccus sp. SDUM812002]|nr:hypothetical protein [Pelagicoccus sp. SDUM812002]
MIPLSISPLNIIRETRRELRLDLQTKQQRNYDPWQEKLLEAQQGS